MFVLSKVQVRLLGRERLRCWGHAIVPLRLESLHCDLTLDSLEACFEQC